jgi:hypothetical protein
MPPHRTPTTGRARAFRAALALVGVNLASTCLFGQAVSTYLPPEVLNRSTESRRSMVELGMFDLNPHVAVSSIYDDNIYLHDNTHEDDFIWVVSPGFDIRKSPTELDSIFSTRLTYSPAFVFFTDHGTNDSIDHFLYWSGDMKLSRLTISVNQTFESSAGGVVDVGNRVEQNYYLTSARIGYDLSEKTSLQVGGTYRIRDYKRLIGSSEWLVDNAVHYQVSAKVRLGLGVSVGQTIVDETPLYLIDTNGIGPRQVMLIREGHTETFVTPSLRAAYRSTEKTDVSLSFGGEWRSYEDGGSRFGPVFTIAGNYHPWDHTTLSLEGHRREQNSAVLGGQNYVTTGFSIGAIRRFQERYRVQARFTYDNADYRDAHDGVSADRRDDYLLLRSAVDALLALNWTVGVFHQFRVNESTSSYDFDNHQAGIQAVWSY